MGMKRCPKCHRFGVEFDPYNHMERCLWKDCLWVNHDNINIDKIKHPIRFQKFMDNIKKKVF